MLRFIWRWKLATTCAIRARYFPDASLGRAYTRLWKLARAGFIRSVPIGQNEGSAWCLTKLGFAAIREDLPVLRESGFESEAPNHDLYCAAFQLGDWLPGQPDNASIFSEQQLRRYDPEMYPEWVPSSISHRADGYTLVQGQNGDRVIGFEVELGRKSIRNYHGAGIFYQGQPQVDRVLWLIGRRRYADDLERHLSKYDRERPSIHNFVDLIQFQKRGWQSEFCHGPERGMTIAAFMHEEEPLKKPEKSAKTHSALHFLNTRKSYVKTKTSKPTQDAALGH